MAEFKNNLLGKLIKESELCEPAQVSDVIARHIANEDAVGIVEAVSQVYWAMVKNGKIVPMSDAQPTMTDPENWLGARFFNDKGELRLSRSEKGVRLTYLSESELSDKEQDYRDTYWLLSGGKSQKKVGLEQVMSEFQVAEYCMPLTGGNSARLIVRQYIDYENETGLAKIVAERFVKLGEEKNNG
jgi:CRISPR-associated protein (TIGR03984 family)